MFVQIALNIPADKLFTYEVPATLQSSIQIGKRVFVSFGRRKRTGFIVGILPNCERKDIKTIHEILDDEPLFDEEDLKFYSWIAEYLLYPLGKTLAELIPAGGEKKDFLWIAPITTPPDAQPTPAQKKLLDILALYPRGLSLQEFVKISGMKNASALTRSLRMAGMVEMFKKEKKQAGIQTEKYIAVHEEATGNIRLTCRQQVVFDYLKKSGPSVLPELLAASGSSAAIVKTMLKKGVLTLKTHEIIRKTNITPLLQSPCRKLVLNEEQAKALEKINGFISSHTFSTILLHGVTGSGKTEIYLSAIEQALKTSGSALYLVPEIALTPQLLSRISGRFDTDQIAVIHSGISENVRYDQWRQIRRGRIHLVIGARSALFAPLPHLRLIIVDEEHDSSYKQDERLCYHARDLAVVKAKFSGATCVLGSATPGIRTYYNAETQKYAYLELTGRANAKPLPRIDIVDMKKQKEISGKMPVLSDILVSALQETLSLHDQALLFLNKRGFDTFLVCADCGYSFTCPNCAVSLKSHPADHVVKCHYCDYVQKAMPLCPHCRGSRILNYGTGTQKLEAELKNLFPRASICRMDSDTTSRRGEQEKMLRALEERKTDILVGTQMIAKGHDFPGITLVGVISADTSLNMPDFRAAEKTFQMLTQVAGRGGRGDTPGRVIVQTFNPQHYVLRHTRGHDYKAFFREEMEFRKALQYPPFTKIINLRLSSDRQDILTQTATALGRDARAFCENAGNLLDIVGPATSPLSKIRGAFRMQMMIKGNDVKFMHFLAAELVEKHATSTVKIIADVDPENFM
ncbi:MAG: primosomal protein N' [Syntrophaceae bacterium]|nr:primosomal protein N' [Syntrophaceae bacterium]